MTHLANKRILLNSMFGAFLQVLDDLFLCMPHGCSNPVSAYFLPNRRRKTDVSCNRVKKRGTLVLKQFDEKVLTRKLIKKMGSGHAMLLICIEMSGEKGADIGLIIAFLGLKSSH